MLSWEVRSAAGARHGAGADPAALLDQLGAAPVLIRLTARFPLPTLEPPAAEKDPDPGPAGTRTSPFGRDGSIQVYRYPALAGDARPGPLLVDGGTFTWLVTDGWSLSTDALGDASLTASNGKERP